MNIVYMPTEVSEGIFGLFVLATTVGVVGSLVYTAYQAGEIASGLKNCYGELRKIREHLDGSGKLEKKVDDNNEQSNSIS